MNAHVLYIFTRKLFRSRLHFKHPKLTEKLSAFERTTLPPSLPLSGESIFLTSMLASTLLEHPSQNQKKLISLKFNSIFSLLSSEKGRRSFQYVLKSEHFQWGHSLPCSAYNEAAGRWTMINCTTCFMKFAPTITLLSHKLFYTPLFNSTTQLPG